MVSRMLSGIGYARQSDSAAVSLRFSVGTLESTIPAQAEIEPIV